MPSFNEKQPIFQQVSEMIENDILKNLYQEGDQIISTTQIAKTFQINPATAVKGINLLVDQDILFKKRGVGMFVKTGAREKILTKRRKEFYEDFIIRLLDEAKKLELSNEDIVALIMKESGEH
ncbi:GntR family transcriptional regulator [Bacillus swezeyi]|uniref:GntR family transcriptional regulator n=1 Tax=Bacillus swezeyi TaxID=1925020 RepID=A0A1R1S072_9BACI|nr:GntR family transcriptional regulator [Bacillus swezeyi]MEC1259565.1 GntR family transcriptional regulator [Bacillus swezeyi]MED2927472.1 GntR family transcriptional regulator [Bacillus swezeyi]MED2941724.1 GntR family transcriptional regulator [Bacillus swezeyi]MED2962670.1 GntR family transcriptional regulator [Bacillus swezeyi]MED2977274.1 GntR family transcriptional regulator [Bacillus swezeyi]